MNNLQIFKWPLAIGLLTIIGLVAGLVSDGWGDTLAAIGLGLPVIVASWGLFFPKR